MLLIFEGKPSDAVEDQACLDIHVHVGFITNKHAGIRWYFLPIEFLF